MNPFANPQDATPYVFPEFPSPHRAHTDFSAMEGGQAGSFKDFQHSQDEPKDNSLPVVQSVQLQDFKEVLQASQP